MSFKYRIQITKRASKSLNKLDGDIRAKLNKALVQLIDYYDGREVVRPDVKMLTGKYRGLLRLRVGIFRIIFKMESTKFVVLIIEVVARKDAYK